MVVEREPMEREQASPWEQIGIRNKWNGDGTVVERQRHFLGDNWDLER